jgi:hypothetical protein
MMKHRMQNTFICKRLHYRYISSYLLIVFLLLQHSSNAQSSLTLTVDTTATSIRVPADFIGFSYDPSFMSMFFSSSYNSNNSLQISRQLLQNFLPNQKPDIRILGNNRVYWRNGIHTAPTAWNMIPGYNCTSCPTGIPDITTTYSTTQLNTYAAFLNSLSYKPTTLFGFSLAFLDSARARDFATEVKSRFSSFPYLFEIGNEPDIYIKLGRRTSTYTFSEYLDEFNLIKNAISRFGNVAGPTLAKINNSNPDAWSSETGKFITGAGPSLDLITMHQYPLGEFEDATISWLSKYLSESYSFNRVNDPESGIKLCIDNSLQRNVPFRLAEANTITLGGFPGVSDAFGSALWVMDYMFELLKARSAGIHIMTSGGSKFHYSPYTFTPSFLTANDKVRVNPIYHGMLFFSGVAVQGSRLLNVSPQNNSSPNINTWVTRDSVGTIRILVINRGTTTTDQSLSNITIRVPGAVTVAKKYDLTAEGGTINGSLGKTVASGATFSIGGQTISTQTGEIEGNFISTNITPSNNRYTFSSKAASSTILEIPAITTSMINEQPNETVNFTIYPNPASSFISVKEISDWIKADIVITNIYGETVYQPKKHEIAINRISTETIPNGIYLIKIERNTSIYVKKLIINR